MTSVGYSDDPVSRLLKLQWTMAREIHGDDEPLHRLEQVLDMAMDLDDLDGIWVWFLDRDDQDLKLNHSRGLDPVTAAHLETVPDQSPLLNQLMVGNEIVGSWEFSWPEQAGKLRAAGWNDLAIWPLCAEGKTMGAVGAGCKQGKSLSSPTLMLLRTMAVELGGLMGKVRMLAELRNSRFNLRQAFKSFDDHVFIAREDGTILYSNADEDNDLTLGKSSPVGRFLEDYLPGVVHDAAPDTFVRQARLRTEDGPLIPVEVRGFQGHWDESPVCYFICRDLSERVVLERERARLITAIEQSADSIVITDSAGIIQYINPAFSELTGYSSDEAHGATPRILKSGSHGEDFYSEMWAALNRGEVWKGRVINKKKNGELFTEFVTISPVRDQSGIITNFVGVKRDVTDEAKLEGRLRQSQKMEAIGTLAGGLAHDFNNILYALLGYCQLAMDDTSTDHPVHASLLEIQKAGNRASNLVAKMLTLGCRQEIDKTVIQLGPLVQEALDLARASLPATIRFDVNLQDCQDGVLADPTQIHQVVLNLCANAQHAMAGQNGLLRVRLRPLECGLEDSSQWPNLPQGKYIQLTVKDTGRGMDPGIQERIFEPYFTTKNANEGTGLGLATVHGIVLNHGGRIYVESSLGRGTTFTVMFPVSRKGVKTVEEKTVSTPKLDASGRVLVVDDEKMIVDLAIKALTKLGFGVTGCMDGFKALEMFAADPDAFDIVVTDQTMPHLTGFELASKLLNIRPDLPIIMTTGYSDQLQDKDLSAAGICVLLPKPLKMRKLAEVVSEMMNVEPQV